MTDVTNTETATGFDALKGLSASAENDAPVYVQKLDAQGRAYSTGKRKNAIARVWVKPGAGKITVNGKDVAAYFARPVLQMMVAQPLNVADRATQRNATSYADRHQDGRVAVTLTGSGTLEAWREAAHNATAVARARDAMVRAPGRQSPPTTPPSRVEPGGGSGGW